MRSLEEMANFGHASISAHGFCSGHTGHICSQCVCVCVCMCVCRFGVALFKTSECKALCGERDEVPSFAIIVHTHTFAWDLNCMKTG